MADSVVHTINIFISSPSDVQPERDAIKRTVERLRSLQLIRDNFALNVCAYEDSVPPVVGDVAQQVVNKYLIRPEESDILICVLWGRMGTEFVDTETGKAFLSGTQYEFEQAYEANQKNGFPIILLYRKTESIPAHKLEPEQNNRVEQFFKGFHNGTRKGYKGLYGPFKDTAELESLLWSHLLNVIFQNFEALSAPLSSTETELRKSILQRFQETNSVLRDYPSVIGGKYAIERNEPQQIIDWIDNKAAVETVALLVDKPGTGKTVVMSKILMRLEERGTTTFAIKADLLSGLRTPHELQEWFHLPASLGDSIKIIAAYTPVVVLIDQLDALSISLSQDFPALDLIYSLVLVLARLPNVRVVVSCREFDLNFDPKLSALKYKNYRGFTLAGLNNEQIKQALAAIGIANFERISMRMRQLLATPLHLAIYADLLLSHDNDTIAEQFYSLHQLYDRLWERQITTSNVYHVSETVYYLAERMQKERRLAVPLSALDDDNYHQARLHLQHIGFIREQQGTFVFFHQTLFDYSYARKFVADDNRIGDFVLGSVQGLLERALMLQVLAYLRRSNPEQYLQELTKLLFSAKLRFHLRYLLLDWFASLDTVTTEERGVAVRLLNNQVDGSRFLSAAAKNVYWFDALGEGYVATLLSSDTLCWNVSQYLSTVISNRPQQVISLLQPYPGKSIDWDKNILSCFYQLSDWSDIRAVDMLCDIMGRIRNLLAFDQCFRLLLSSSPQQCCRVIRICLDYLLEEVQQAEQQLPTSDEDAADPIARRFHIEQWFNTQFEAVLNEYTVREVIASLADVIPYAFIEYFFDWFVKVTTRYLHASKGNTYPSDSVFGFSVHIYHTPHEIGGREEITFVKACSTALQTIAREQPPMFRDICQKYQMIEAETIHFVLAQGYLSNPEEFANDIFDYLLADNRRMCLGVNRYDACLLFSAAFRFVDTERRAVLEAKILAYYPDWERDYRNKAWGITQSLFLQAAPRNLLSSKAIRRLQELERKFPPDTLPRVPHGVKTAAVGSPITEEQIERASDNELFEAMKSYDETTERALISRKPDRKFGVGGITEFSRLIGVQAKKHPQRFYDLAGQFDETIAIAYVSEVLSGLAGSEISADYVFDIARRYAHRFREYSRIAFCHALEQRADNGIPSDLLDIMTEWALTDPHPIFPDSNYQNSPHTLDEWLQRGINSVRGVSIEAVVECSIKNTPEQIERAFTLLTQAINDLSPAVAACCLESLVKLLDKERTRALDLCEKLLLSHPQLLEDHFTWHIFLSWASFYYYGQFGKFAEAMLTNPSDPTRREGARLICQAALRNDAPKRLVPEIINGDALMRRGAASTYARYLPDLESSQVCQQMLLQLASDDDTEVKHVVASCFAYVKPEIHFEQLHSFIDSILGLPAIETSTRELLEFVKPISDVEHELALQVTERVVEILKRVPRIGYYADEEYMVSLPLTVYNRSYDQATKERAMKLFEQLLDLGVPSAKNALDNWDEHRAFALRVVSDGN